MEFVDAIGELKALPEGIHLLCPRQNEDDYGRYDDLGQVNEDGKKVKDLVVEAKARKEKFLSSMRILAYNADGVEELQAWVLSRLDDSLEKCDLCIKEYYTGKIWLMELLKENYQEEDIEAFAQRVDEWDIKRITRNLTNATTQLKSVPPQQIALDTLDRASLLAIFETLSCEAMLRSDSLLQEYFDEPFKLIQTKRTLKISDYVPAVTRFLFDSNQLRSFWAISTWTRYNRPPTTLEFEWALRDGILSALQAASQQPPQMPLIQRLWRGMQLILKKLDKEQITHQLRALDIDPCRLSVDHLAIPTPGLRFLLNTMQIFLEKAPTDFWDAMQTISPQALIEQTFHNPQFSAFLMQVQEGEPWDKSVLKDILSWISPFLTSLKGAHQPSACRALALPLLKRFQDPKFPNLARYHCFHSGLLSLLHTLRFFTDDEASRGSVARVVLKETMEVLGDTIHIILNPPTFAIETQLQKNIVSLCMDVVRNTLALECQSLKSDYEVILRQGTLSHGVSTYSAPIWEAVIRHLHPNNLSLSQSALLGILPLVGLEGFPTPSKGEGNTEKKHFNTIYGHLTKLSCQIVERLSDFPPEHLNQLFSVQDTASALISALFAADLDTYQASVDLIKNVSGQSARRDAISHLLDTFFLPTMYGLSWSFRRISNMKTFAPAPRMLHTGTDIVEILCNSQTGMLRTRSLTDRKEILSLQKLWEFLWSALSTIFDETEAWHLRGNDKSVMLEFCRDTIQFADFLFDQYGVFLGALGGTESEQKSVSENFLNSPNRTMNAMVKWLRLKDEYLANTLVGLVAKLLRRLGALNVEVTAETALRFIEGVAVNATIKTILTPRDKAELVRALEAYQKKPVVTASTASLKKQSSITAFAKPSDSSLPPSHTPSDDDFDDLPDSTLLELSRSVELNKDRRAAQAKRKPDPPTKMGLSALHRALPVSKYGAQPQPVRSTANDVTNVLSFREKREREKEAKKRRDQAELARLKGHLPHGVAGQTAEQGSGLKGIGIMGKDHAVPAESMMVSSGSDTDSSSEDELDTALFGAKSKKPEAVSAYEQSKKQSLQQMPVKKVRRHRSMKDMRARLVPDLAFLHHAVLSWDYFATGDQPPNADGIDYVQVANKYRSPNDYQSTFQPLLILEAWQGFQQAKEEGSSRPFEIKVMSRLIVDSWIEFSTQPLGAPVKDFSLGEGDLILFSSSSNPTGDPNAGHLLARVCGVNRKSGKQEVTYRTNPGPGTNKYLSSFATGSTAFAAKITSLTPVEREFGALSALQYYDLCEEIVLAKPSPILTYAETKLEPYINNYLINLAQAKAIKSAIDNDGFTLIQGPPGSGKTKTITALIGSLLTDSLEKKGVSIGTGYSSAKPPPSRKILVCAPSNAAVDELVMRLKNGVKTIHGREEKISVVRLGRGDAINTNVLDVTLDELVAARLNKDPASNSTVDMKKLYEEHKKTDTAFKEARSRLDECRAKGLPAPEELEREFEMLKKKRAQDSAAIDKGRDQTHTNVRNADLHKKRVQQEIINGAHVICATLSGSGHDIFQSMSVEFETVIIDEAAQCIELSALIPLKYGCQKCVLVGDPKQLPPTVLSRMASKFMYEQSLFVRMQKNHPRDVHLLDTQYRMHPDISRFPSATFYDGKLQDGPSMAKLNTRPWHQSELLTPYRFFDVQGMHSSEAKGHSLVNYAELQVAMQLYNRLITDVKEYDFDGKIGIITPYKGQLREMKIKFAQRYGEDILKKVDFNTTDAFQGRESEIIIFSCVRASNSKGIGFLSDIRRMNVGLTRAKTSLWVLGNSRSLEQGEFWNGLIKDARNRSVYTEGNIARLLERPQFTGYKDVKMEEVDEAEPEEAPQTPAESVASIPSISRPSSASIGLDSRSVSVSASARGTPPIAPPDGPSGGHSGLDKSKMCGLCGSADHFTHNCDNDEAKATARGQCFRCKKDGHTKMFCNTERCTECGEFGHRIFNCQAPRSISKEKKLRLQREEADFKQAQRQLAERRRQSQLGDHDRKVPVIQATNTTGKPIENPGGKRKRPDSSDPEGPKASRPRTENKPPANAPKGPRDKAPANAPKGSRAPAAPTGLIKPSRDGPAYPSTNKPPPTAPTPTAPSKPKATTNPNVGQPKPRPPMMRKKKQADPFIRPKPRPK
ncbi:Zinc finger CCHC-type [Penicillium tannophilum]|nr:Zinc finger CCHC-type [Penicillium tannophilum]